MKILNKIIIIFVGVLFIFSGLIKINDPMGTAIKLEEYFEVFSADFASFFHWFIPFSVPLAVFLCVIEVVLGIALLVNYKKQLTIKLLAVLIIFFTFLTFYSAYFNKVTDCGCFGDAIPLTPWQSFGKDVLLTILIGILLIQIKSFDNKATKPALAITAGGTLFSLVVALYALSYIPPIDFRDYKVGNNIATLMQPQTSCVYEYIMQADEHWDLEIKPKSGLLELNLSELWRYKDLVTLFVRRDFVAAYKQTIFGHLWHFLNPLFSTIIFTVVFHRIANISTDGLPPVLFYMLDMFSIEPISTTSKEIPNSLLEKYPFYDLTGLEKSNYKHKENTFELSELKEYRGGVSNKVFGTKDIYLTKIPFIKWQKGINPHITSHTSSPINLADFTSVLFHFKFTSGLYHKIQRVIKEDNYWDSSSIYKKYAEKLNKEPLLTLHSENARLFSGTNKLLTEGFIQTSTKYLSAHKI